jgi:SAM-dependent methyltransferase
VEAPGGVRSKDLFPAVFSRHAAAYQRRLEEIMSRGEARGRQRVIDLVEARPGMHVLDLACGPGTLSIRLAALVAPGGDVVGVDLAEGMIKLARSVGIPNARFETMDMEDLSFPDRTFDAATCGHGLQFAPNLGRALSEAHRVLRDNAPLAASVPVGGIGDAVWAALDEVIDRRLPPAPQPVDDRGTRDTVGDAEAFRRAAMDAGFARAEVEIVDERVHWPSAEHFVAQLAGWWSCATRLDEIDPEERQAFTDEALDALRKQYPGPFETAVRNHVLHAIASGA